MPDASDYSDEIQHVADTLRKCQSVLFITGAGISADSGLPTYRGVGGMYEVDTTEDGYPIEEILSGYMLKENPALTWKYLMQIGDACRGATFNRAHAIIAEVERHFERVWVLTQNVDGFHRAAGSTNVIDMHGDMHELVCTNCGLRRPADPNVEVTLPPMCPDCGGIVRPDVVLFGELLPTDKAERLTHEVKTGFDAVFSIGTSSLFPYILWPVQAAHDRGNFTVEINPTDTDASTLVDVRLPLGATVALEEIWSRFLME